MDSLYPNLDAAMEKHGITTKTIAEIICRSEEIVNLKLRGVMDWSLSEALAICRYLQYPDLKTLFFTIFTIS